MRPREASLLRSVERILKERGICYRKRHGSAYGVAGDPDVYFVVAGRHCEIELKRVGEEPTLLQRTRLAEWARAGALTGVVHTPDELRDFLEKICCFRPPEIYTF
jgi:hypothetical protein